MATMAPMANCSTATCQPCRRYFERMENRTGASCRCLYRDIYSPDHPQLIADCHNLEAIPDFSSICNMSDVYSINLQRNKIKEIGANAFRALEFSDAVLNWAGVTPDLILLENDIHYIHKDAFKGAMEGKLSNLDLKYNDLKTIPLAVYTLVNLTKLYLRDNQISTAEGDPKLTKLRELDLTSNKLDTFPSDLCRFPSLRNLYLDGNPIQEDMSVYLEDLARCKNLLVLTWPKRTVSCNQTQLEVYANTSSCKEMIIRSGGSNRVMCDSTTSSGQYRGVSLEVAILRELAKICPGISAATKAISPQGWILFTALILVLAHGNVSKVTT